MSARACNIGPGQVRRRRLTGLVALGVGVGALVALADCAAPAAWRLALFLPFWVAALGFAQARAGT